MPRRITMNFDSFNNPRNNITTIIRNSSNTVSLGRNNNNTNSFRNNMLLRLSGSVSCGSCGK
jgi:hypothetical protein